MLLPIPFPAEIRLIRFVFLLQQQPLQSYHPTWMLIPSSQHDPSPDTDPNAASVTAQILGSSPRLEPPDWGELAMKPHILTCPSSAAQHDQGHF